MPFFEVSKLRKEQHPAGPEILPQVVHRVGNWFA